MLGDVPDFMQGSYDVQAVVAALAEEVDSFEAVLKTTRRNISPLTVKEFLPIFEALFAIAPVGSLARRRGVVLGYFRRLKQAAASGADWESALAEILGTNWTYAEYDPDNPLVSPDPYVIEITVPFALTSSKVRQAQALAKQITPAHISLVWQTSDRFIVGVSKVGDPL